LSTTVDFSTVAHSIKSLSITDVTILDIHEIPSNIGLDFHVLAPIPNGYVSDVDLAYDDLAQQNCRLYYSLNYRYYHCTIGADLFDDYAGLITAMQNIFLAFASDTTLSGAMNNTAPVISNLGPVTDPMGNSYHGFDISIHIMQFLEV
jgi:hypothetical protein